MSIAPLSTGSPTLLNRGGHAVSERAAVQRQSNPSADAPGQFPKNEIREPRNPLVAAMLEAIQSLAPARPPAAPAPAATDPAPPITAANTAANTATAAPTPSSDVPANAPAAIPAVTPEPSSAPVDLKELSYAFAHELYSALRSEDAGKARGRPENPGSNGHHGHHGHHGVTKSGYGDLAQRLEALAQQLGSAPPAPAPTSPGTPAPGVDPAPAVSLTPPATLPVLPPTVAPSTDPDGAVATPSASAVPAASTPTATTPATATPSTPAAAAPADSPLLSAFRSLLCALAPSTTPSTSGTDSATEKLAAFLHQMAQSLGLGSSEPASSLPASGSLLNVTA